MNTKLINIIEANANLEYENFYDFDIDKIFISSYLPKEIRIDKRTKYLSLFGEKKDFLDGDSIYWGERSWRKWESSSFSYTAIKMDDEYHFYSQVLHDLRESINGCDYLIITGAIKNIASVFLEVILDIAKEKNIVTTVLYCAPYKFEIYPEINKNQVKHYNQLVSRYKQVNFIHADFILYDFIEDLTANMITNITTAFIYNITSILVDMSKNNKIPNTVIYNTENINSMDEDYYHYMTIYELIDTYDDKEILEKLLPLIDTLAVNQQYEVLSILNKKIKISFDKLFEVASKILPYDDIVLYE